MKRITTLLTVLFMAASLTAQIDTVTIAQINTPVDLANCNDTSMYYQDTVTIFAYVVTDGGLSEVASSSITGANGIRPFIWLNDTANGGAVGPRTGLEVMGVNWGTSQATAGFTNLIEGELIELTGVVGMFGGATQFQPLNDQSLKVLSGNFPTFTPRTVAVGTLNDAQQVNQISSGQEYEGAFVKINNVVVTAVSNFGSGTSARVNFTVADSAGNQMTIYDFFLGMKLPTWNTLNPNSPATNGSFTAPTVGTFYNSITGVIEHSSNGCAGGTGNGYRLHPFKASHFDLGKASPAITNVSSTPFVPSSSDSIVISANVNDPDGTIDSVNIFWSADTSMPISSFTKGAMTLTAANTYGYTIPPQNDGDIVRYYIQATDNDTLTSNFPITPAAAPEPNTAFIYVLDGGLTIMNINRSFDGSGTSPFDGQTVTVKGFVTSSDRNCDLGYVYIQDTSGTEHAGIALRGSLQLAALMRGEEVEVTGTVSDGPGAPAYDFASISISSITSTGNYHMVEPVELNIEDTTLNMEAYEGMLVKYVNPNGQIHITDDDIGFGEYRIANSASQSNFDLTKRVLAGRDRPGQAEGSLFVSLVSDSSYATTDGTMQVPVVKTQTGMTMDGITGIIYYAFGNYKLTPRNNRDFENLSVSLDTSCKAEIFSVGEVEVIKTSLFPNPAKDQLTIGGLNESVDIRLFNMNGTLVKSTRAVEENAVINVSNLSPGVYLVQIAGNGNYVYQTQKVVITE